MAGGKPRLQARPRAGIAAVVAAAAPGNAAEAAPLHWGGSGAGSCHGDELVHGNGEAGQNRCGQGNRTTWMKKQGGEGTKLTLQVSPCSL